MGEWVYRDVDRHRHDYPMRKTEPGMRVAKYGDIWKCSCNYEFIFEGWDTGDQRESYPPVAKWRLKLLGTVPR